MRIFTSLLSIALSISGLVDLYASANPMNSRHIPASTNTKWADLALVSPRTVILPQTNFPVGQCRDFSFEGSTFSAFCEVQRDDAGPPKIIQTSVDLGKCIANDGGTIVYRADGNAFQSCIDCYMPEPLYLTCICASGSGLPERESSINLAAAIDATSGATGRGVFTSSLGQLDCVGDEG